MTKKEIDEQQIKKDLVFFHQKMVEAMKSLQELNDRVVEIYEGLE